MKNHKIEFNNGFVTAIALFLEHKLFTELLPKDKEGKLICDLRLYGATDHLYNIEIPKSLKAKWKIFLLSKYIWVDSWLGKYLSFFGSDFQKNLILYKKTGNLVTKIFLWKERCFQNRLMHFKDTKITDELFKEAEEILKLIDEEVFGTKEVIMEYR